MNSKEQVIWLVSGAGKSDYNLTFFKLRLNIKMSNSIVGNSYYDGRLGCRHNSFLTLSIL